MVAVIQKNAREEIRVSLDDYKGQPVVNVRVWFGDGGEYLPSKKGLAFRLALLPEVIAALESLKGGAA